MKRNISIASKGRFERTREKIQDVCLETIVHSFKLCTILKMINKH